MKSLRGILLLAAITLIASGCSDNTATPVLMPPAPAEGDVGITPDSTIALPEDMSIEKPAPIVASLRLSISPWRSEFSPSDTPEIKVYVTQSEGNETEVTQQALLSVEADSVATITEDRRLAFSGSGAALVTACYSNLCDQKSVIVNDGPPRLTVIEPPFGAFLLSPPDEGIRVLGTVSDDSPTVVTVNGIAVQVDEDGGFETQLPPSFGMNSIKVEADDGLSLDRAVVIRDVLWSEVYTQAGPTGLSIPGAAALRVDQRLFDSNESFTLPEMDGVVSVEGVSEFIEVLLQVLDVSALIDPSALFSEGGPDIQVSDFTLGPADVDFEITSNGLNLFLTLPNGRIETAGTLDLQGQSLPLEGSLDLVLTARVGLNMSYDGTLQTEVESVDVALESLHPNYASDAVTALLILASPEISALVEAEFSAVLGSLLGELVTSFISEGIGSLFESLQGIEFNLSTGIGPDTNLSLLVSLAPQELSLLSGRMLVMDLDFDVSHNAIDLDYHDSPGCPIYSQEPWTEIPSRGVGLSMRPAILNCVLYSAWRQGLLNFPVPIPGSLAPIVSEVTIDAYLPPLFRPSPTPNGYPFEMQFGSLLVSVKKANSDIVDRYSISLRAGMRIDLDGGALAVVLADLPEIRATLEEANSDSPLPTALLEQTMVSLVWEDMKAALLGGLDLSLGEVPIDLGDIQMLAPRLADITIEPTFDQRIVFLENRLSFEGILRLSAGIRANEDADSP